MRVNWVRGVECFWKMPSIKDWETVTSAFWVKYLSPDAPHVKHVDTLNREVDDERGLLRVKRLFSVEYSMPSWAQRVFFKNLQGERNVLRGEERSGLADQ